MTTKHLFLPFAHRRSRAAVLTGLLGAWLAACALPQEAPPARPVQPPAEVKPAPAAAEEGKPAEPEAPAWLGIVMEVTRNLDLDEDEKPLPGVGVMDAVEVAGEKGGT